MAGDFGVVRFWMLGESKITPLAILLLKVTLWR